MDYENLKIDKDATILRALQQMDETKKKMLLVFDGEKFLSIITIGAIQRAIIKHTDLSIPLTAIVSKEDVLYGYTYESTTTIKKKMLNIRAQYMPVLDNHGELVSVYAWEDFFPIEDMPSEYKQIDIPVVIMAGGKGTRLKPITNVIPKPLVPIGEKTILEVIMDQFESIGCHKFFMSVNYKADMMKYYLSQLDHKYNIDFFMEDKPLGTIGSVSLLKGKITSPFFVSNCDSINEQDYRDVYDYHINNHNEMTIVTMVKSFQIPYGVIETGKDGLMIALKEKPELTYQVNTGVYILNPECIDEIPQGTLFHVTHLMEKIRERGGRVGCFPVSENSWHDMGEWQEYLQMINVK